MADTQGQLPATGLESSRSLTIVVYVLFMVAPFSGGLSGLIGVIIAYVKRSEVRGTVWESHIENQITTFWIGFMACIAGTVLLVFLGLGFLIWAAGFIYVLYRSIKGLLAALENRPYVA
jgi:uncharacterized membrane protein